MVPRQRIQQPARVRQDNFALRKLAGARGRGSPVEGSDAGPRCRALRRTCTGGDAAARVFVRSGGAGQGRAPSRQGRDDRSSAACPVQSGERTASKASGRRVMKRAPASARSGSRGGGRSPERCRPWWWAWSTGARPARTRLASPSRAAPRGRWLAPSTIQWPRFQASSHSGPASCPATGQMPRTVSPLPPDGFPSRSPGAGPDRRSVRQNDQPPPGSSRQPGRPASSRGYAGSGADEARSEDRARRLAGERNPRPPSPFTPPDPLALANPEASSGPASWSEPAACNT